MYVMEKYAGIIGRKTYMAEGEISGLWMLFTLSCMPQESTTGFWVAQMH